MNNTIHISHMRPSYYTNIGKTIANAGYMNPAVDTDKRQKEIMEYIEKHNIPVRIEHGYDFTNMAPQDHEYYKYFQSRSNSENKDEIDSLYREFYEDNKPMIRLPMGFEIDGQLFCGVGNHRCRTHKRGIERGHKSKGGILILGDGLSVQEKIKHGLAIAAISNRKNDDITQPEGEDDIKHQCKMFWELECQSDSSKLNWTEDQKISWAKNWISTNKYQNDDGRITRMANEIFSSDKGQAIPMPETKEITKNWKQFWPRQTWDPPNQKTVLQERMGGHDQRFKTIVVQHFENRDVYSTKRQEMWLAVRAGSTMGEDLKSLESIIKKRTSFLRFVEKYNVNINYDGAGFPEVKQIMFLKQTDHSDYEAYEWNIQTEKFDKIT